ncbi:MAG: trimethylamine methyltransferase family protein [Alphaproteobacteria bacterium]
MARDKAARRRKKDRTSGTLKQLPRRTISNPYPPIEVLSDDQIEAIHEGSLDVLENLGMKMLSGQALDLLAAAGADVDRDSQQVRLDRGLVLDAVAKAPSEFTLHARNPANNVVIGGSRIAITPVSSAPNCSDLDRGRRPGTYDDFNNFLRIAQDLNIIHFLGGYPVEPQDLPVPTRHLDCYYSFITLTDMAWRTYSLSVQRCIDGIDMAAIALGKSRDEMAIEPAIMTMINTNSPLLLDGPMADGMIEMARAGQAVAITPFTLSGAMAPVTIAGALTQQNAEALAAMAVVQIAAPGAPMVYGGFTSNVDMKTGAPAFGTPENTQAALAGGQLARRYGIPYRSSNVNASNAADAQSAYESEMAVWGAFMGHANIIHHGAAWLEGGLCASFEKMIIDAEILQMMAEFLEPIVVDDDSLAIDAMAEAGPGGHFFGTAHTLARYETAFYQPMVSDWRNFETWEEQGALTATQRANGIWKQMLKDYQPPALDPAIDEELQTFIARRKEEEKAAA